MEEELERDNNQEEEEENYENEQEEPYENYDENNELRMEEGSHLDPPQDDMGVQEDEERNEEQMGKTDLVTQSEVFPRKRMIVCKNLFFFDFFASKTKELMLIQNRFKRKSDL